jgi:guanylate kinase
MPLIPDNAQRRGRLLVVSAPSGAGKTSLVHALREQRPTLGVSVSHTTRPRRPNETDGREYHFVSVDQFKALLAEGAFLEHARVFDNFYGTGRAQLNATLDSGRDIILEIDWQGARQVRLAWPGVISIFILPPSRAELERRLRTRATDSDAVIARRLRDAADDMSHCPEFDYAVVNDRFEQALAELGAILDGQGGNLRADRAVLAPLLQELTS